MCCGESRILVIAVVDEGSAHDSPNVFPSSSLRLTDALTALSTISLNLEASKLSNAAAVVPLGLVTFFRNCAGSSDELASMTPAPRQVCFTRRVACSRESPRFVALSIKCSTRAKKYAGPDPDKTVRIGKGIYESRTLKGWL